MRVASHTTGRANAGSHRFANAASGMPPTPTTMPPRFVDRERRELGRRAERVEHRVEIVDRVGELLFRVVDDLIGAELTARIAMFFVLVVVATHRPSFFAIWIA